MAEVYYDHSASQIIDYNTPFGTYDRSGLSITVSAAASWRRTTSNFNVVTVSGTGEAQWSMGVTGYVRPPTAAHLIHRSQNMVISTVSGGLSGVTGIGVENGFISGLYLDDDVNHNQTLTPVKEGYRFSPSSFTFDEGSGGGVTVSFTASIATPNKPTNPTPTDTDTGIVLLPTLSWQAG